MASNYNNGNGNGQRVYFAISIALGSLGFVSSLLTGAYTLANPKGDVMLVREDLRRESERLAAEVLDSKRYSLKKLLSKDEHIAFVKYVDQNVTNLKDEVNRIRADQVTRSEHKQHWDETDSRISVIRDMNIQLRKEMNEAVAALQKEIGSQFTIGDQIKSMNSRMDIINGRLDTLKSAPVPPAAIH